MKRILITGGAGYLGSVLSGLLLRNGYEVIILDKLIFGKEHLRELILHPKCKLITGDIRDKEKFYKSLKDINAFIHLAGISDEPTCNLNPALSKEINYHATMELAALCKERGIKRFIFSSSCSVYGNGEENICTEDSAVNPLTIYAKIKADTEKALMSMQDASFAPLCLRLATLFGLSYRMRFDLVINSMLKTAIKEKKIFISGGEQWRPVLHVHDAAHFFLSCLNSSDSIIIKGGILNVGSNDLNYRISELAVFIKRYLPEAEIVYVTKSGQTQSYKINSDKIERSTGFRAVLSVERGIKEILKAIGEGALEDIMNDNYYNIKIFKQILKNGFLQ